MVAILWDKYGVDSDPWFVLTMHVNTDYLMCLGAMEQAMEEPMDVMP